IAQLLFNALLAAVVAVLPDQVPIGQRGLISGILGVGMPIASVSATFLVNLFTGNQLAMFLVPCAIGGCFILLFAVTLNDRRLAREDKPAWSLREIASTFYGFLVGMAISGLGFGVYLAVDLALVVDVLPNLGTAAKDLGVFNIAGALPFSIAPALAPTILAIGGGSYGVLYAFAGACAIIGAAAVLPVKRVR